MSIATNQCEPLSLTVKEFCKLHRIGRTCFYRLLKDGRAPETFLIGRTRRVPYRAALEWRGGQPA